MYSFCESVPLDQTNGVEWDLYPVDEGLRCPVFITRNGLNNHLHPGKSRCRALRALGRTTVPAVIWTQTPGPLYEGEIPLTFEEAQALLPEHTLAEKKNGRYVSCILA